MTFGEEWGWGAPEDESKAILHEYLSQGGNFIDTVNGYTRGHSEKKFFQGMFRGDPNGGGTGRKAILRQLHESLRRNWASGLFRGDRSAMGSPPASSREPMAPR
ncbi:aldo/keto reductase [Amycolatopsis magusensis]|nr:aldo/keto reductase [Amycolatopsis magusensis]